MLRFGLPRLGISGKLALSGALGVALVTGMVLNEQGLNGKRDELLNRVRVTSETERAAVTVEASLLRMIVAESELRHARSPEHVDRIADELGSTAREGRERIADARRLARLARNRALLGEAETQFVAYLATSEELIALQREIVTLRGRQTAIVLEWNDVLFAFLHSPIFPRLPRRLEIERALIAADASFKDARIAIWAFYLLSGEYLLDRAKHAVVRALRETAESRSYTVERYAAGQIERLTGLLEQYRRMTEMSVAALRRQAEIRTERAEPLRAEVGRQLAEVVAIAAADVVANAALVEQEKQRAGAIRVAAGLIVIVVLVGSALFTIIGIARPVRRIGEVLAALAGGDKSVEIPFAGRRDEVGEAARAADTFKQNMIRLEAARPKTMPPTRAPRPRAGPRCSGSRILSRPPPARWTKPWRQPRSSSRPRPVR